MKRQFLATHPKPIWFTALLLAVALIGVTLYPAQASAVISSDWSAGQIIDDSVFYDNTSMSVADIQNFLNSKVPSCDTNGTQKNSVNPGMTNAQYAASQGWPGPPYVCLKDYMQVPRSDTIIDNFSGSVPNGSLSAAQIIKNAADDWGISPKAILVTLHKESLNIIYDTWPIQYQYKNAMGYGCPDTAPCDPSYAGFYNQVNNAAYQFKLYKQNSSSYRYKPFQTNSIYYNPNSACGASNVNVQNYATAGLYNYTPYQPNQAALNNLYGTGDDCSAYGNRNFWRVFNDWFGSTRGIDYQWQVVSQDYYTDATKTVRASSDISPNGSIHLVLKVKNTGTLTWNASTGPINLAVLGVGEKSDFCGAGWLSCNRPATLQETSVAPGQTGTFEFDVYNPGNLTGVHRMYVSLVAEGKRWFNNPAVNFYLTPQKATYTWSIQSQLAYTDSSMTTSKNMWNTRPGETAYLVVKAKNTGNITWSNSGANPVNFATAADRISKLCTQEWRSCNRPATLQEASVAPGQTGTFAFPVTIPNAPGDYIEHYSLVSEGKAWFDSTGINYWIKIVPDSYTWSIEGQQAFTDSTMTTAKNMWSIKTGESAYLVIKAKNTGNVTWTKNGANPLHLATSRPYDRSSAVYNQGWLSNNRPAVMTEDSVAPGQIATFAFPVTMPAKSGNYIEHFNLVAEGKSWLNDTGLNYYIKVQN